MRFLISVATRIYPPDWRARYGAEFDMLISQEPATVAVLIDVVRGGLGRRVHSWFARRDPGENRMRDPIRLGTIACVVVLPTLVLVSLAILKYIIGVPGPFDAIEPTMTPIVTHPIGESVVVLAPYVALGLAILPITRVRTGWRGGRITASAELSAPLLNVAVAVISLSLIAVMGVYWVVENLGG